MTKPQLFIIHRHQDRRIAAVLSDWVHSTSAGKVSVWSSGHFPLPLPPTESLRAAAGGRTEVVQALRDAEALFVVHTGSDKDWSLCMWECGVASASRKHVPTSGPFHTGTDLPIDAAILDARQVNIHEWGEVLRFTRQFMQDPDFFASLGGAVAGFARHEDDVHAAALKLHHALASEVPMCSSPSTIVVGTDIVECSVFAPPTASPGEELLVQVYAHLTEESVTVKNLASEFDNKLTRRATQQLHRQVARGSRLDFVLFARELIVDSFSQTLTWVGQPAAVQFGVRVPPDTKVKSLSWGRYS